MHCIVLLQSVDIRQIADKFPDKTGGLRELFDKGPQSAFFLVKFWVSTCVLYCLLTVRFHIVHLLWSFLLLVVLCLRRCFLLNCWKIINMMFAILIMTVAVVCRFWHKKTAFVRFNLLDGVRLVPSFTGGRCMHYWKYALLEILK